MNLGELVRNREDHCEFSPRENYEWAAEDAGWRAVLKFAKERKAVYAAYLESEEWQGKRIAALKRASGRCQICNTDKRLDVHHRTYERIGDEASDDLTVLCRKCHELFHGKRKVQGKEKDAKQGKPCSRCGKIWTTKELCSPCRRGPKKKRNRRKTGTYKPYDWGARNKRMRG